MRRFILTFLTASLFMSFRSGEPVATLSCKSASGKTTFTAEMPSCLYLQDAELNIDGSKLTFSVDDKSNIIFDPDNKVFTLSLESQSDNPKDYKFLKFWAIPSSFKKIRNEKGPLGLNYHYTYEFHAKLNATEPQAGKELNRQTIELVCTLDYEL